jgi:hypothetical protein
MSQNQSKKKPRASFEQRSRRRNQIIFLVLSTIIILSMVISLVATLQ